MAEINVNFEFRIANFGFAARRSGKFEIPNPKSEICVPFPLASSPNTLRPRHVPRTLPRSAFRLVETHQDISCYRTLSSQFGIPESADKDQRAVTNLQHDAVTTAAQERRPPIRTQALLDRKTGRARLLPRRPV